MLCTVNEVNWMVVAVSPYDDETMNLLLEEFEGETDRSQEEEFPWYKVSERPVKVDLLIEPGETEQLTQEFVIKSEIGSTITSAYVVNGSDPKLTDGWYAESPIQTPQGANVMANEDQREPERSNRARPAREGQRGRPAQAKTPSGERKPWTPPKNETTPANRADDK